MATAYRYFVRVKAISELDILLKHFQIQLPCGWLPTEFISVHNGCVTGKGSPDLEYPLKENLPPECLQTIVTNAFIFSKTRCFPLLDDFVLDIDMKAFNITKIENGIDWSRTVSDVVLHTDAIEEIEFRESSRIKDTRQIRMKDQEYFIPVEYLYLKHDFKIMLYRQLLTQAWNNINRPMY